MIDFNDARFHFTLNIQEKLIHCKSVILCSNSVRDFNKKYCGKFYPEIDVFSKLSTFFDTMPNLEELDMLYFDRAYHKPNARFM